MKRFLRKRWLGIPAAIIVPILLVCLLAGGVFAAYSFLSFTTNVTVDEPLSVEYNLQGNYGGDLLWHPLGDLDSQTIQGSAGDIFNIDLRINNRADTALMVNTVITGNTGWFSFTGFPNGSIPGSDGSDTTYEWSGAVTISKD